MPAEKYSEDKIEVILSLTICKPSIDLGGGYVFGDKFNASSTNKDRVWSEFLQSGRMIGIKGLSEDK